MKGTLAVDFEFYFNLSLTLEPHMIRAYFSVLTSQFVAVRGTRENIHPSCDGRSEVSRIYLPHLATVPLDNIEFLTGLRAQ
jgi:hypothetical protein